MRNLGLGNYRRIMHRRWFCARNFHCAWISDSDVLNRYLGHWRHSLEDHYQQVKDAAPWYIKLAKLVPSSVIKSRFTGRMTKGKDGTMHWIQASNEGCISAFWGSREKWEEIPSWYEDMPDIDAKAYMLDHGYDESKSEDDLAIEYMQGATRFRGGECFLSVFEAMREKLRWRCAFGHEFEATPVLILKGGHWCPECLPPLWNYDKIAMRNSFFAQIYYTNHDENESNYYDRNCYEDIL